MYQCIDHFRSLHSFVESHAGNKLRNVFKCFLCACFLYLFSVVPINTTVRLTNKRWTDDLSNTTSEAFRNLSRILEINVSADRLFKFQHCSLWEVLSARIHITYLHTTNYLFTRTEFIYFLPKIIFTYSIGYQSKS